MTDEQKMQFLAGLLGSGNTHIGQLIMDNHGTMNINNGTGGGTAADDLGYTDEEVAQALANIVGRNKAINSKQKWAGAHWGLRWLCNYPVKALDFCVKIDTLPLPDDLEFKCDYRNIRELSTLSFMNEDARQLDAVRYSKSDEPVYFQMKEVVVALSQELQRIQKR